MPDEEMFAISDPNKERTENIKKSRTRALYTLAIIVVAAALIYQLGDLSAYFWDLYKNAQTADAAREIFSVAAGSAAETTPEARPAGDAEEFLPEADAPEPTPNPGILALQQEFGNDDIFAYISIPDTNIDYPVVQGTDNDFYLTHDLAGAKNSAGSIFADYLNDAKLTDKNTVIYGHNMRNGSMFHNLRYYRQQDFYNEHRYITLTTLDETTVWEIFAAYDTTTDFNYIQTAFASDEDFMALVDECLRRSAYDMGVSVSSEDTILTLSTCTSTADNMRFAVHARRVS